MVGSVTTSTFLTPRSARSHPTSRVTPTPKRIAAAPGSGAGPRFAVAFPTVRTARDTARLAAEVFALPARIAAARRQRMAIALDEFQAMAAFDGENVEHALRAAVQEQRSVGYVF